MALAKVQTTSGTASTGNVSATTWTPTNGNLLLVAVFTRLTSPSISVSGNGQTWNTAPNGAAHNADRAQGAMAVFYCIASSPSAGQITATITGNSLPAVLLAIEISGADVTTPIENDGYTGTGGSDNSSVSAAISTLTANAWALGFIHTRNRNLTPDGTLTSDLDDISAGTAGNIVTASLAHKSVASPGSATISGSLNNTADWLVWAASIKPAGAGGASTARGYAQAMADIKQTYFGLGQSQADIKATSNGYGQSRADIKAIGRGFAQSQADIKAVSNGYGQAQADIKAVGYGLGQANADIKATSNGYGQSQADIKATSRGFGQTQAKIVQTYFGLGQSQADIKATSRGYGQSQADIKATSRGYGQAQADVKVTSRGYGQANATVTKTAQGYGQAQAAVKAVSVACGAAQADIKAIGWGFGQATAWIKTIARGSGQTNALIRTTANAFGQAQSLIKTIVLETGQAQALIKTTTRAFGQALATIVRTHSAHGQAAAKIALGPEIHLRVRDRHSTSIQIREDKINLKIYTSGILLTLYDWEGE